MLLLLLHQVAAVLGAQWGDEGKGKLVDILAQQYDVVARAQVIILFCVITASCDCCTAVTLLCGGLKLRLSIQSKHALIMLVDHPIFIGSFYINVGSRRAETPFLRRAVPTRGTRSTILRATSTSCTSYRRAS